MNRLAVPALVALAAACAQPGSPSGGEVDRTPPLVVDVYPEPFDTLEDLSARMEIRFDERISERVEGVAELRDAVLVSPRTGVVQVEGNRRSLEIWLAGGWTEGLVYRVVVLPVFSDLFQNQRLEPVELVFSTGAPITEGALAGFVEDRLTGEPVVGARVEAVRRVDEAVYQAVTDSAGFFALRYLPPGEFDVTTWLDQDRDLAPDFLESTARAERELALGDTAILDLGLLPGDTTAARMARVAPLDSLTLELLFDDYFAPGPVAGEGRVFRTSDSTLVTTGDLLHPSRLDSLRAARRPADPAPPDTVAVPDTAAVEPLESEPEPGAVGAPGAATGPLPTRELILVLQSPLQPDSAYYVVVEEVTNIRGIPGGGGTAPFRMPPPPPPDTTPPVDPPASPDTVPAEPTRSR